MSISELELEVALVENGTKNSYLIVNETPRVCVINNKGEEIGVYSSQIEDRENPRWEKEPEKWTFWQPEKASHPIYIERNILQSLHELMSVFICQAVWHPETQFPNISSFCVYPIKHHELLKTLHA